MELRFVERNTEVVLGIGFGPKIKVLQFREQRDNGVHLYYTKWTDVPLEIEASE